LWNRQISFWPPPLPSISLVANGPANTLYDFTRVDLDGDKRRDALVMMKGPP